MKRILLNLVLVLTFLVPAVVAAHPGHGPHSHVKKRVIVKKRPIRKRVVVHRPAPQAEEVHTRPARRVLVSNSTAEISPLCVGLRVTGVGVEGLKLHLSDLENPVMGGLGIQLRSRIDEYWGLELASDFMTGGSDDFQQTQVPVTLSAMFFLFPESSIQPYLLAGAGLQFTELDYFNGKFNYSLTEAIGQVGLGVDVRITDRVSISGDFRGLALVQDLSERSAAQASCLTSMPGAGGLCGSGTVPDEKLNAGIQFMAGVAYTF